MWVWILAKSAEMLKPMSLDSGGDIAGAEIANKRLTVTFFNPVVGTRHVAKQEFKQSLIKPLARQGLYLP